MIYISEWIVIQEDIFNGIIFKLKIWLKVQNINLIYAIYKKIKVYTIVEWNLIFYHLKLNKKLIEVGFKMVKILNIKKNQVDH
jgi:hypothetical protein